MSGDRHASEVIELTDGDIAQSIANAEQRLGCTLADLAEMNRTRDFPTLQHRIAWVALGGFYKPAPPTGTISPCG